MIMNNTKEEAKRIYEEIQGGVKEVLDGIRNLIEEGTARRLIIKNKEGEVVFQTKLAFGVGGAALVGAMAPVISAIGMFAMFLNDYQILVEKEVSADEPEVHGPTSKAASKAKNSEEAEIIEIVDEEASEDSKETNKESTPDPSKESENKAGKKTVGKDE